MSERHRPVVGTLGAALTLVALVLLACGRASTPANPALTELKKVAPLTQGGPALVFVYTDG